MHIKLETGKKRVYGLSFHTKKPWILAGLGSGGIELWDYYLEKKCIRSFDVCYNSPVRGLDFHKTKALFVSGGDDKTIKIWDNLNPTFPVSILLGHSGYIRTVQFHHEQPWIVSASDDQTIRIWNWKSRNCIAVLKGHDRSVTCASFHPEKDFVLSASLDQTVRVWDIASLSASLDQTARVWDLASLKNVTVSRRSDRSNHAEIGYKYKLQGHQNGVNWASFHPTLPLIVSGSDDLTVKLWSMTETEAEPSTLKAHTDSVAAVQFNSKQDTIFSLSQDQSIRVWDATKRVALYAAQLTRIGRPWSLAVHPNKNLLAVGHERGMIVFKLERERPAFSLSGNSLFVVKDGFLWCYDFSAQSCSQVLPIRGPGNQSPRTLSYSPKEDALLIFSNLSAGGSYELYIIPKDSIGKSDFVLEAKRGTGDSAVFISRNWFAVLEKSTNQVLVKNLEENKMVRSRNLPIPTDAIYYAGTGKLLCRSEDKVVLFDLEQGQGLGQLEAKSVRYAAWSNDMERVALLSKQRIIIASKTLVRQCILDETIRVKSGVWADNCVFIYSTMDQIKYCLPDGGSGVILSVDDPLYITKVTANTIFCLDRDGGLRSISIDARVLSQLSKKKYNHVMSLIRNSQLYGQAMMTYLQQKGLPEVADERIRFNLAIESHLSLHLIAGNLEKLSKLMKTAEEENNAMGRLQTSFDVEHRVEMLKNAGHLHLAYITALAHGLHGVAKRLASELGVNLPLLGIPKLLPLDDEDEAGGENDEDDASALGIDMDF